MSGFGQGGFGVPNYGGYLGNLGSAPPMQFTSKDVLLGYGDGGYGEGGYGDSIVYPGTIIGPIDGTNRIFHVGVVLRRAQIWRNGVLMTLNYDVSFGNRYMVFSVGQTPQVGDSIMMFGWIA
jgi:hypothetical protein